MLNGRVPWKVIQQVDGFAPRDPITAQRRQLWAQRAALNHPNHPANRRHERPRIAMEKPSENVMENVLVLPMRDFALRQVEFEAAA